MKKPLYELNREEFDSLKSSGLLWELYPDAVDSWDGMHMHTPGPWEVRPSSNKGNGTSWMDIVSMGTPFTPSYVGEALKRDAYLIASAPELLRTLKSLLADIEDYQRINNLGGQNNQSQINARTAIAKAERGE
jgi:hypothetical protein